MSINYRLVGTNELDAAQVGAWRTIQAGNPAFSSPYFCPEFTLAVGQVRDDVRIVLMEEAGRPVGFFPHQRSALGGGKPVGGPLSDFHGVVVEPGIDWDLSALMRAARLSVWSFDHLVGDAGKFERHATVHATSPQIDLSSGYQAYAQGRRAAGSDYIKKTEGLARKMGREIGELRFVLHDPLRSVLDRLIAWKQEQYRDSKLVDVFGVSWTRDLLYRIAQIESDGFAGVCSSLSVGSRIVAVHMGMRSRDVLHYWFPAYDPEFGKFSTGIVLLLRMAEAVAGMGLRTIDLGKGDSQYKQRLMTGATNLLEGAVELPSLLATARQLRRSAEARMARGGLGAALNLPLRAIRRIERTRKFS